MLKSQMFSLHRTGCDGDDFDGDIARVKEASLHFWLLHIAVWIDIKRADQATFV